MKLNLNIETEMLRIENKRLKARIAALLELLENPKLYKPKVTNIASWKLTKNP